MLFIKAEKKHLFGALEEPFQGLYNPSNEESKDGQRE
jgi:hypothetical protein